MARITKAALAFAALCAVTVGVIAEPARTVPAPVAATAAPSITVYKNAD